MSREKGEPKLSAGSQALLDQFDAAVQIHTTEQLNCADPCQMALADMNYQTTKQALANRLQFLEKQVKKYKFPESHG